VQEAEEKMPPPDTPARWSAFLGSSGCALWTDLQEKRLASPRRGRYRIGTGSVAWRRRRTPMCYTSRDWGFEEEARRPRAKEDRRRRIESERPSMERPEEKPLTEKVKEMVGAR